MKNVETVKITTNTDFNPIKSGITHQVVTKLANGIRCGVEEMITGRDSAIELTLKTNPSTRKTMVEAEVHIISKKDLKRIEDIYIEQKKKIEELEIENQLFKSLGMGDFLDMKEKAEVMMEFINNLQSLTEDFQARVGE